MFVQDVLLGPPATQLVFESFVPSELPSSILMIRNIHVCPVLYVTGSNLLLHGRALIIPCMISN